MKNLTEKEKYDLIVKNKTQVRFKKTMRQLVEETGLTINKVFRITHDRLVFFNGRWYVPVGENLRISLNEKAI